MQPLRYPAIISLGGIHDAITRLFFGIAMMALLFMLIAYLMEVFQRYFLSTPTVWATDLVTYLLCTILFLALPAATATRRHIAIRLDLGRRSNKQDYRAIRCVAAIGAVVCGIACVLSLLHTATQFTHGAYTVATVQIPKYWLSLMATYSFGSSALYFLRDVFNPRSERLHKLFG